VCSLAVSDEREKLSKDLALMRRLFTMVNAEEAEHFGVENAVECFRGIEDRMRELEGLFEDVVNQAGVQLSMLALSSKGIEMTRTEQDFGRWGRQQPEDSEPQIETMIEKIDRYNESEKIFSKELFY
jgi:hypothetical protein